MLSKSCQIEFYVTVEFLYGDFKWISWQVEKWGYGRSSGWTWRNVEVKNAETVIMITVISGFTLRQRSDNGLATRKWRWNTWKWCSSCWCRTRDLNRHPRWGLIARAIAADLRYSVASPPHTDPLRTGNEEILRVNYKIERMYREIFVRQIIKNHLYIVVSKSIAK